MKEIKLLRSMWSPKVRRETDLIVPQITLSEKGNSLNNDFWAFKVTFAFRNALDIKYEERKKDKEPYLIWTQGPFLNFKEADLIHSQDESRALQVQVATPVVWDFEKNEMYQGRVSYIEYVITNELFSKVNEQVCTQMQFLELLIKGNLTKS